MKTKICTRCKQEKVINEFGKKKTSPDGFNWHCKECVRLYYREHYAVNSERVRESSRLKMAKQRSTEEGRARINAIQRKCRENGGSERQKIYMRKLRDKHFFVWRTRTRRYGKQVTAKDLARLWKQQKGRCVLSGRKLDRTAHIDHIIPISKGGKHEITNLRWLDPLINVMRQNLTDEEFINVCKQICEYNE